MSELSAKQLLLLNRFYDGEVSFFGRWQVRRLLARHPEASGYMKSLSSLGDEIGALGTTDSLKIGSYNLWPVINNRIEQEERSAFFLGTRTTKVERMVDAHRASIFSRLGWGATGAFTTAGILGVVVLFGPERDFSRIDPASSNTAIAYQQVETTLSSDTLKTADIMEPSLRKSAAASVLPAGEVSVNFVSTESRQDQFGRVEMGSELPSLTANAPLHSGVELEWMRSDGRVVMMPSLSGSSFVIWVRRHNKRPNLYSGQGTAPPPKFVEPKFIDPAGKSMGEISAGAVPVAGSMK